jgi:hypothetical protein
MTVTKIYEIDSVIYCKDCGWNMEAYTDVFATNNGMIRADWFHWCSHCGAKGE